MTDPTTPQPATSTRHPPVEVRFREALTGDVADVVALVESAYRGEDSRLGWTTEADLLEGQRTDAEGISAIVESLDAVLLLAVLDGGIGGGIVGCCELRRMRDCAYFGTFAVNPRRQGGGVGRRLLTYADAEAVRRWGSTAVQLTVIAQRGDLIAWYERLGFVRTGERRPFPYGEERFGLPLRDDLEFVVLSRPTGTG